MRLVFALPIAALAFFTGCSRPEQVALSILEHSPIPTANVHAPVAGSSDRSAEFLRRFDAQSHGADAAQWGDLKRYHVIVVHGLLGEVGIRFTRFLDKLDINQGLVNYLKDQDRELERAGVDAELLEHKSDSVERGGEAVARSIRASTRPVLLISHSKGCLDTLEALCVLQREGQLSKVAGWIAIQGPFRGAPEADKICTSEVRRVATRVMLNCLGARSVAVRDMTSDTRGRYLAEHKDEIARLTRTVPVLSFASAKEGAKPAGSDGSVPVESAILEGSEFIAVDGLSHSASVIGRPSEFNRAIFTRVLVQMLLERVEPAAEVVGL